MQFVQNIFLTMGPNHRCRRKRLIGGDCGSSIAVAIGETFVALLEFGFVFTLAILFLLCLFLLCLFIVIPVLVLVLIFIFGLTVLFRALSLFWVVTLVAVFISCGALVFVLIVVVTIHYLGCGTVGVVGDLLLNKCLDLLLLKPVTEQFLGLDATGSYVLEDGVSHFKRKAHEGGCGFIIGHGRHWGAGDGSEDEAAWVLE